MVVPKQIQELFQLNVLLICTKDIIPRFKITVFVVHFCRRALCGARELKVNADGQPVTDLSRAPCGARENLDAAREVYQDCSLASTSKRVVQFGYMTPILAPLEC